MSCSKWSYTPEKCDGDSCVGDCDNCQKADIDNNDSEDEKGNNYCEI